MTDRLTCTSCHQPIRNGEAVIRSVDFEQVATHKPGECVRIPAQRQPSALARRIAEARA